MDPQRTPSTSSLDDHFNQILRAIEHALASQMRTTLDSYHSESTEETLSNFADYLLQIEEARDTSDNPQADAGLIFDQSNLLSVHDLLRSFWDLGYGSLNLDHVGAISLLSDCHIKIEEILAGSGHESDATDGPQVSRSPSPMSYSHNYLAGVGVWSQSPFNHDTPQDEIDTADDNQTHNVDLDVHFASRFDSDNTSYYDCIYAASLSDVNDAHSSIAVQPSEMSVGEDEH